MAPEVSDTKHVIALESTFTFHVNLYCISSTEGKNDTVVLEYVLKLELWLTYHVYFLVLSGEAAEAGRGPRCGQRNTGYRQRLHL